MPLLLCALSMGASLTVMRRYNRINFVPSYIFAKLNFLCDRFHNELGTELRIASFPSPKLVRTRNIAIATVEEVRPS